MRVNPTFDALPEATSNLLIAGISESCVELPLTSIKCLRMRRNGFAALWGVLLLLSPGAGAAGDLFVDGAVWRIRLEVTSDDVRSLRNHPREYVHATLRGGTNILRDVAVRLKGSTSFRSVDDKPSFTVTCDRFTGGQRFHALSKIHLNNSVEDPSY